MPTRSGPGLRGRRRLAMPPAGAGIPQPPTPTPTPTPTPVDSTLLLSGIDYVQIFALHPNANGSSGVFFGYLRPRNGIGPFVYKVLNPETSNYRVDPIRGTLFINYYVVGPATDTANVSITDARGTTVQRQISIAKRPDTSPFIAIGAAMNPPNDGYVSPSYDIFDNFVWSVTADGLDHSGSDAITLYQQGTTIVSTKWVWSYAAIRAANNAYPGPPGDYPLTVKAVSPGGDVIIADTVLHFDAAVPTTGIEFQPQSMSTASLSGLPIGTARATTAQNKPVWTLTMASGLLAIGVEGVVTLVKQPTAQGNYPYSITVTDGRMVYTQDFSLTVFQGETLALTNMNIPGLETKDITNYNYFTYENPLSLGVPTITGFAGSAPLRWFISAIQRTNYFMDNGGPGVFYDARDGQGHGYGRFTCDPTTGEVSSRAGQLSTGSEWFELSVTDGINVCTRRFTLTIRDFLGPVIYVGAGMSNAANWAAKVGTPLGYGRTVPAASAGYEHLAPVVDLITDWHDTPLTQRSAGIRVYIMYNADVNYYAKDLAGYDQQRKGMNGPASFIGVPGPGGELPRLGGLWRSPLGIGLEKAFFISNQGDFLYQNLHMSHGFMGLFGGDSVPASDNTISLIRQNSGQSGDITIINCDLHDADVILECGNSDGKWKLKDVRLTNGAGSTSTGGSNQHNAYLGACWAVEVDNLLTYGAADGHVFKCRAMNGVWTNSRFYDGERGSGFNALDLCEGGKHVLTNCVFEKGPAAQNPKIVQYGEEAGLPTFSITANLVVTNYVDTLDFVNCTFISHHTDLEFDAALTFAGRQSTTTGAFSTCTFTDCSFTPNIPAGKIFTTFGRDAVFNHDFSPTVIRPVFLTTWPALDFTSPCSYDNGRPWWHNSVTDLNNPKRFPDMGGKQIDPGVDEIRVAASLATGSLVCSLTAYGTPNWGLSTNVQPDPNIDPFLAGSVWSLANIGHYTGSNWHWTNVDFPTRYAIVTNGDGTGQLNVGAGGLGGPGLDVVYIKCVNPAGTRIVASPFFIVKT